MPLYRVHRIKEGPRENFRWAPHTGGLATVKFKDYEGGEDLEGNNPYDIWKRLSISGNPLCTGDLLELINRDSASAFTAGDLWIAKYIGLEPAQWYVPEPSPNQVVNEQQADVVTFTKSEGRPS